MSAIKEKVVLLTGASRGIGLAIAHYLLSHHHKVLLISRTESALSALSTQYGPENVAILPGDMTDASLAPKAVALAKERWGRLDALIVNHGTLDPVKRVDAADVDEWKRGFDVNFFSAVGIIQAALPLLRSSSPSSSSRIILVSSGAAASAYQSWGCYGATKAALNHLAQTLGVEEPSITTISVRPGVVDTDMQRAIREEHHQTMSAKDKAKFADLHQSGKLLRPEQPGHVIAKLAVEGQVEGLSGKFVSWDDVVLGEFQEEKK